MDKGEETEIGTHERDCKIMKVVFTVFILTMFICGCVSSDCFVSATANPQMGEKYRLYFNTLKVVQV